MKKLISITLVLVLAGGLILSENKKAEAIDPASAALIGASIMLLPLISAVSHEHDYYRPAPAYTNVYYDDPYPVQPRVVYRDPGYYRYNRNYYRPAYGDSRYRPEWREHRGFRDYRTTRADGWRDHSDRY